MPRETKPRVDSPVTPNRARVVPSPSRTQFLPATPIITNSEEFWPRKGGRSLFKTAAQKKYKLSRIQMDRIKPFGISLNMYGSVAQHYNECDVKELAEQVQIEKLEKEQRKKDSPRKRKPSSPQNREAAPATAVAEVGSAQQPIMIDD